MKHMTDSALAATMKEAFRLRERMKADGATTAELDAAMERTLRAALPQQRVWRYECEVCWDTGLEMHVCRAGERCNGVSTRIDHPGAPAGSYTRLCAHDPNGPYEHDYGTPCLCRRGVRFRPARPAMVPDDEAAARTPRKPARFGR